MTTPAPWSVAFRAFRECARDLMLDEDVPQKDVADAMATVIGILTACGYPARDGRPARFREINDFMRKAAKVQDRLTAPPLQKYGETHD